MKSYLENNHVKLALQLVNFASKINSYATTFGFTANEVTAVQQDAAYFAWVVNSYTKMATGQKQWTAFKTELLTEKINAKMVITPKPLVL